MKEHPIIFSTESVKAILEGRKIQTRRVIKPQPVLTDFGWVLTAKGDSPKPAYCPYGQVGDRLWIRRTKQGKFIWKKSEAEVWLEITGVRVERLQEITIEDVKSEGILIKETTVGDWTFTSIITDFAILWDSLNFKRGYGWDTNPWVWVIEFKNVE